MRNRQQKRAQERAARRQQLRNDAAGDRPLTELEQAVQSAQESVQKDIAKHALLIEAIKWCDKTPETDEFSLDQSVIWTNELDELASDIVAGFAALLLAVEAKDEPAEAEAPNGPIVLPSAGQVEEVIQGGVPA